MIIYEYHLGITICCNSTVSNKKENAGIAKAYLNMNKS